MNRKLKTIEFIKSMKKIMSFSNNSPYPGIQFYRWAGTMKQFNRKELESVIDSNMKKLGLR